jgi:catechol 2,3-dioxygenase-like lactoylglutathione lyase family enzyme
VPVTAMDHVNIHTEDVEGTVRFYEDVIGLRKGNRPPFPFPGAWLYCGDRPVIHLVGIARRNRYGSGTVDHVAFEAVDIEACISELKSRGLPFEVRDVPRRPIRQVFVRDPNGVKIELNFRTGA